MSETRKEIVVATFFSRAAADDWAKRRRPTPNWTTSVREKGSLYEVVITEDAR